MWYLNDGTFVGRRESLKQVLDFLGSSPVEEIGLKLNHRKCELWWPKGDDTFPEFPTQVIRQPQEGVEILKVPIGTDNFICSKLHERASKVKEIIERLENLEDVHLEFTILRACLGACKYNYVLRGICPSEAVAKVLQEIDDWMHLATENLLQGSISHKAWLQAGLAPKDGGLGLRHLSSIAHPAYIGSSINTAPLVGTLLDRSTLAMSRLQSTATELLTNLGEMAPDSVKGALRTISDTPSLDVQFAQSLPRKAQSWLQESVDSRTWNDLLTQAGGQERDRLEAIRRPHAGAWLSAFPCKALGLWIPSREFMVSCG